VRGQQQFDIEQEIRRTDARQDPLGRVAAQHLRAALGVAVGQAEQPPHPECEAGARGTAHARA
jgi:hypothetical protein